MSRPIRQPKILLPHGCDMQKWSVIACDQFTSDIAYWNKLDEFVGESPSTLRLILPECYLGRVSESEQSEKIRAAANGYLNNGVFTEQNSYIYVRRRFNDGSVREGLVAELDLECYDFKPQAKALVRATEDTVVSRLPARVKIRQTSKIELPHIMVMCDDPHGILFGAVKNSLGNKLYGFTLNAGGGEIEGYAVNNAEAVDSAADALINDTSNRLGENLFALVGDGNHSLAAAKQCYEIAKAENKANADLLRYALCEIVNIYDCGIRFEPIHRAIFGADAEKLQAELIAAANKAGCDREAQFTCGGKSYKYKLPSDGIQAVRFIQSETERYVRDGYKVDYIHGDDVIAELGKRKDCIGIKLPPVGKNGFTEYVLKHGVLPKKTFSMGDAVQKRYYLEARRISD